MRYAIVGLVFACGIATASAQDANPAAPAKPADPACLARGKAVASVLGQRAAVAFPPPALPGSGYGIEARGLSVEMSCDPIQISVHRDIIYGPTPATYFGLMIRVVAAFYGRPQGIVTAEIDRCLRGAVFSPLRVGKVGRTRAGMRATRNVGTLTASGLAYGCTFYGEDRRGVEISIDPAG